MSRASSRNLDRPQCELDDFVNGMFQLGQQAWSQFFRPSLQIGKPLWGACAENLQRPISVSKCMTTPLCEIPETECPPRCVCELRWEATPGEKVKGTIRVTNTGGQPQAFTFPATALVSDGHDSGLAPTVAPANATLKPGESKSVEGEFHSHRCLPRGTGLCGRGQDPRPLRTMRQTAAGCAT